MKDPFLNYTSKPECRADEPDIYIFKAWDHRYPRRLRCDAHDFEMVDGIGVFNYRDPSCLLFIIDIDPEEDGPSMTPPVGDENETDIGHTRTQGFILALECRQCGLRSDLETRFERDGTTGFYWHVNCRRHPDVAVVALAKVAARKELFEREEEYWAQKHAAAG